MYTSKEYSVEDYSHAVSDDRRFTTDPVCFGIPYEDAKNKTS